MNYFCWKPTAAIHEDGRVCKGFHILTFDLVKVNVVLIFNETKETAQSAPKTTDTASFFKLTSEDNGSQYFLFE